MRIIFSTYIEFEDSEFNDDEDLKKNLKNKNLFKKNYQFLIEQHEKYADHLKIKYKLFVDDDNWKNYKMNNYSKFLDKKIFNIVGKCADKLNYETYVVGGWVRDLLMGRIKKNTRPDN